MTAVNRPIVDDLVARHPWLADRAHVLPNGFDRAEQPADVSLGEGFWIVHTGRLYGREQQVAAFLEALATLPADVKALFVGVDESRVRPDADRLGLGDRVRVEPLVPLPVALGYQRAADALLLVNGRRPESMSSKVFEYLQAGRPIFAISPAGSAARGLFAEAGGGTCVLPDDPMAEPLAAFVAAVREGTAPVADPAASALRARPPHRRARRHPGRPRRAPLGGRPDDRDEAARTGTPLRRPVPGRFEAATAQPDGGAARSAPSPPLVGCEDDRRLFVRYRSRARPRRGRRRAGSPPPTRRCSAAAPSSPRRSPRRRRASRPPRSACSWWSRSRRPCSSAAGASRAPASAPCSPPCSSPCRSSRSSARRSPCRPCRRRSSSASSSPWSIYAGVCYLLVRRDPMPFAAKDLALPAVLWFAWLLLGLVWAPDKLAALNYIAIVVTMAAVLLATAAAGGTRRRLIWFGYTMLLGYAFVVGFTILEARLGIRLPTSRLLTTVTSQTYAVTSVFHNQNDLATYIVLCWPFMLCAFFFTRKLRWLALTLLFMAMGAAAFVRTGSRSSLVAAGISSLAAVVLFWHLGPRLSSRTGKVVMGLVIVGLVVVAGWLLFNNSSNDMLRQFRLESLLSQAEANKGSGAIRSNLTERGLQIAGGTLPRGRRPGAGRGHHRLRHRRARHQQPAQLVAGDLRRRRPRRASPCTWSSSCCW